MGKAVGVSDLGGPTCAVCATSAPGPFCPGCGAHLWGPAAQELARLDAQVGWLQQRRAILLAEMQARPAPPAGVVAPPPGASSDSPRTSPQVSSILLALGTALLVVAAIVFAAVSWSRLSALGQGALLVGLTLAAGAATRLAVRRGLQGTGEAFGVMTVVMGPLVAQAIRVTLDLPSIDDGSWSNWLAWSWWPLTLASVGLAAWTFGRWVGVRGPQLIGAVLVQCAPALWILVAPLAPVPAGFVLALQGALVAVVTGIWVPPSFTEVVWRRGSAWAWTTGAIVVVAGAFVVGADGEWGLRGAADLGATLALVGVGAFAVVIAACRAREGWSELADATASAATVVGLLAVVRGCVGTLPGNACWPAVGLVAVVVAAAAGRVGFPRGRVVGATAGLAALAASFPLVATGLAVASAASDLTSRPWSGAPGQSVVVDAPLAYALGLPSIAVLVAWLLVVRHRFVRHQRDDLLMVLGGFSVIAVVGLAGTTVVLLSSVSLMVAVGLGVMAARPSAVAVLRWSFVASGGVAAAWSSATPGLTLVALVVALGVAVAAVFVGIAHDDATVSSAGSGTGIAAFAGAHLVAGYLLDVEPVWNWAALACTGAVLAAGVAVALRGDLAADLSPVRTAARNVVGGSAMVHLIGVAVLLTRARDVWVEGLLDARVEVPGLIDALTVSLAFGAVALAVVGVRRDPRLRAGWPWLVASATEVLVLAWVRFADAEVDLPEAYILPLAGVVGLTALLSARARRGGWTTASSWELEGPPLALALGPTSLVALGDPGIARLVVALGVAAVALAAGAALGRRALVDVGVVVVLVLGGQTLLPYAAELPRWIVLAVAGSLLVGLGATFEQRRQDLTTARMRYRSLR